MDTCLDFQGDSASSFEELGAEKRQVLRSPEWRRIAAAEDAAVGCAALPL